MPEHRELDELRMIHSTIGKFLVDTAENRILEGDPAGGLYKSRKGGVLGSVPCADIIADTS